MSFQENAFYRSSKNTYPEHGTGIFSRLIDFTHFSCKLIRLQPKTYELFGFPANCYFFQDMLWLFKCKNFNVHSNRKESFSSYVHLLLIFSIMKLNWYHFCKIPLHYCVMCNENHWLLFFLTPLISWLLNAF